MSPPRLIVLPFFLQFFFALTLASSPTASSPELSSVCSQKWLTGYRLAPTAPQKTLINLSVKECEEECLLISSNYVCSVFAYGTLPPYNNTCELAIAPISRTSRSVANESLSLSQLDKSPPWDVYVLPKDRSACVKKSYLFGHPDHWIEPPRGGAGNIPIDCFYRLLSGKRLSKPHSLKSVSVSSLLECQDACIREQSFSCRSISYRYMPSGYSYSVSNCELSPFFIMTGQREYYGQHDFIDDFDYDFFQREPYCKTTGSSTSPNSYGVCAVVVRRSGRITPSLIKSSHQVTTPSQCEHFCTTALFRCRAFAFRHTDRGHTSSRDPFHRHPHSSSSLASCQLYEGDLSRLPSYNIEPDPDYDLHEMGRLMDGQCMLQNQWERRGDKFRPATSTFPPPPMMGGNYYPGGNSVYDRPQDREINGYYGPHYPTSYPPHQGGGGYNYNRPSGHSGIASSSVGGGSSSYVGRQPDYDQKTTLLPGDRRNYFSSSSEINKYPDDQRFITPPSQEGKQTPPESIQHQIPRPIPNSHDRDYQDRERDRGYYDPQDKDRGLGSEAKTEGNQCIVPLQGTNANYPRDAYLVPEIARATFPAKTTDECMGECMRSLEVLRFPCRVGSFRYTSGTGGICQLSDTHAHSLREQDFTPSSHQHHHHMRDQAMVFYYDENIRGCQRIGFTDNQSHRRVDDYYYERDRGNYYTNRGTGGYYGDRDRGVQGGSGGYGSYYDRYGQTQNRQQSYYPMANYDRERDPYYYGSRYPTTQTNYHQSTQSYYDRDRHNYRDTYQDANIGRYTVDGERCLHSCVRNKEAGFFYCQTDNDGAWNFCCRPDDGQCGYSRGLSFAWCYVGTGPSRDIWRTCKRQQGHGFNAQFIHDGKPPEVLRVNGTEPVGNLGSVVDVLKDSKSSSSASKEELVLETLQEGGPEKILGMKNESSIINQNDESVGRKVLDSTKRGSGSRALG